MKPEKKPNLRLVIVCIAAAAIGLSMAIISLGKLLLMLGGLGYLVAGLVSKRQTNALRQLYSPAVILLVLATFALSLLWSIAPPEQAVESLGKFGKLLFIPIMVCLIQNRREAVCAVIAFTATQALLVLGSWALFAGVPVPWASSSRALIEYAVFSTDLDQGIISATFAMLCWNLRSLFAGTVARYTAITLCVLSLLNVFLVLGGRSGHAVAIALMSLAVMWEVPRKYRPLALFTPVALVAALLFLSPHIQSRFVEVVDEVQAYQPDTTVATSVGIRLNLWLRARQSIAEHPVAGSGVGSWTSEYERLETQHNPDYRKIHGNGNPHQEYLLWGVQLGVPGILLLGLLLAALWRDSMTLAPPYSRAVQSAVAALAVSCLFNCSLYDSLIGDFFCITLGLFLALGRTARADAQPGWQAPVAGVRA